MDKNNPLDDPSQFAEKIQIGSPIGETEQVGLILLTFLSDLRERVFFHGFRAILIQKETSKNLMLIYFPVKSYIKYR